MKKQLIALISVAIVLGFMPLLVALALREHHTSFLLGMDAESTPLALTWAVAWSTTVLAAIAGWALLENHRLIHATEKQASHMESLATATTTQAAEIRNLVIAAGKQADAAHRVIEEMHRDRELAWAPYLVECVVPELPDGQFFGSGVNNIGVGPALNCRWAHVDFSGNPPQWNQWSSSLFHLGARQMSEPLYQDQDSRWHQQILHGLFGDGTTTAVNAYVCEDQLGNRYRFVTGQAQPTVWHPGDPEQSWTRWYSPRDNKT